MLVVRGTNGAKEGLYELVRFLRGLPKVKGQQMAHPHGVTEAEQAAMVGRPVKTLKDAGADDWSDPKNRGCQWGVLGRIIHYSNSHGLCFEVRHNDGSVAWYDPGELGLL